MKFLSYLIIFSFVLSACSTSQKNTTDASTDGSAELLESTADEVGSAPEDLLAEETGAPEETAAEADPFADLKNDEDMSAEFQPMENTDSASTATVVAEEPKEEAATVYGGSGSTETYVVKAGDTLMKIAFSIYGDLSRWRDLQNWNQAVLKDANELKRGMQLQYEAPEVPFDRQQLAHSYVIKKGDTLAGIADEVYGKRSKYRKLQRYNQNLIKNPHKIFAGFTIFYDITQQEMAEAEARRKEKMAMQSGSGNERPVAIHAEPIMPKQERVEERAPVRAPVATTPPPAPDMSTSDITPMAPTAPNQQ